MSSSRRPLQRGRPDSSQGLELSALRVLEGESPVVSARPGRDRAVLKRFPYAVYFRITADEIIVLAMHGRQDPLGWQTTIRAFGLSGSKPALR